MSPSADDSGSNESADPQPSLMPPPLRQKVAGGWVILGIVGWFFAASIITGIAAWVTGIPNEGPEFDEFFNQYFPWILFGVPALVALLGAAAWAVSEALTRRRERIKRRETVLTSRAKALQVMVREAQEVSRELERYLEERLAALSVLNTQVDDRERLAALTPEQVQALERALRNQFVGERRSGLRNQVIFLVLAFVLGFVVNWLSDPALDWLRHVLPS